MKCWKEILKEALTNKRQLEDFFQRPFPQTPYSITLPARMAKKIKEQGPQGPLARQFLPAREETAPEGSLDPIGDDLQRQENGIIHRYHNRILLSPTPLCPVQCRYCFRKNGLHERPQLYRNSIDSLVQYLSAHPQIDEVIFSGGDPLIMTDQLMKKYLLAIAPFQQVKFIRLHSRTPIMLPERLTDSFIELFQQFRQRFTQIHLVIHINHWSEMDASIISRLALWQEVGLSLMAQSVLLKNVNDRTSDLYELFFNLANLGIRPYYLHHPDPTRGGMHFYLPVKKGLEIYHPLRDQLSGWALPHYVRDHEDGSGKTLASENLIKLNLV